MSLLNWGPIWPLYWLLQRLKLRSQNLINLPQWLGFGRKIYFVKSDWILLKISEIKFQRFFCFGLNFLRNLSTFYKIRIWLENFCQKCFDNFLNFPLSVLKKVLNFTKTSIRKIQNDSPNLLLLSNIHTGYGKWQ